MKKLFILMLGKGLLFISLNKTLQDCLNDQYVKKFGYVRKYRIINHGNEDLYKEIISEYRTKYGDTRVLPFPLREHVSLNN